MADAQSPTRSEPGNALAAELPGPPGTVRKETGVTHGSPFLATPQELPRTSRSVVQMLFVLLQLMYAGFYVGALANLAEIEELFSILPRPALLLNLLMVTAVIMIPVRAFILAAVVFRPPRGQHKLLSIWPFLLVLDELWALSPFLLLHHINFGLALACTALLVYSPFAQRSLILMGAVGTAREVSTTTT